MKKMDGNIKASDGQPMMFQDPCESGAEFSECRKYRYALWRIWDRTQPLVMFIGLNPSTANETKPDNTIKSVTRISKHNGFGGFYMMNCFPIISSNPSILYDPFHIPAEELNDRRLEEISKICQSVVFAWGAFPMVKEVGRDRELRSKFPNAMALAINKDGSPMHPLYCKSDTKLISYK